MNIFYEENGGFKVGTILADNTTSLQVENLHGKRSKVKAANVMLRFGQPGLADFMAQAENISDSIDIEFLWESCPSEEFDFNSLAQEYFGHAPTPAEAAGTLIRLHSSPMHFYKKGKGRYKSAPPDALKAAQAGAEKKRQQAALQEQYQEELCAFRLPADFTSNLAQILYKPDRNTLQVKALEAACAATQLSPAHLLQRCGAIPSTHDYFRNRFLYENFPQGTTFPDVAMAELPELPEADVVAFSIDDATTTEIDDAFSLQQIDDDRWRVGIHIAAPALGVLPDSPIDKIAAQRLSTVYMPGDKITMLPDNVVDAFTLRADRKCPALSLYLEVDDTTLEILSSFSKLERLHIADNLRHDTLEPLFNEATIAAGKQDYRYAHELMLLWRFACKLEAQRGKADENGPAQIDYNFYVDNDHVTITDRKRGSPLDKVVAELMILANSTWGKLLDDNAVTGIYRTQNNGKVKMSTVAAPHQGLGVAQYMWSSSPLRRYIDLVNQRQIISLLRGETPSYGRNDEKLFGILRDFDFAYTLYNDFQRQMERYWCLRWLLQERGESGEPATTVEESSKATSGPQVNVTVLRDNLVRLERIPLVQRVSALPELAPNTRAILEITGIDLLELTFNARFISEIAATPAC